MSIESSTKTTYTLTPNKTVAAFLVHESSDPVKFRDFVAYYEDEAGNSDKYVVKVASEEEANGMVLTKRITEGGSGCSVSVVLLEGTSGGVSAPGIQGGTVVGTDLVLTMSDASTVTIDMSSFIDDTNLPQIISAAVSGTSVEFTRDDGSTFSVDMSAFLDDTNLPQIVSGSIVGTDIEFIRDDASTVLVDISSLGQILDIANQDGALTVTDGAGPNAKIDLAVSADTDNALEIRADGVYVPTVDHSIYTVEEPIQTIDLAVMTPLTVNTTILSELKQVEILDSAGKEITEGLEVTYGATSVTIESNVALTGVKVHMSGVGL